MEIFWKKLSNVNLNKKNEKVETYDADMKISFKKIKTKDENELVYYKNILNKKEKKIYDIIEDYNNNILYVIYDSNENIDELINNNLIEKKEAIIDYEPIK